MITSPKCPNCGSTAQVRVKNEMIIEPKKDNRTAVSYECGCGCSFTKVIKEEFEHCWS